MMVVSATLLRGGALEVVGRFVVERRVGDTWVRVGAAEGVPGGVGASGRLLLEDNERLVIEPVVGIGVEWDGTQRANLRREMPLRTAVEGRLAAEEEPILDTSMPPVRR